VRALAWLTRLGVFVVAGALLAAGVVVGVGPRVWRVVNAHSQVPVVLPAFGGLSQRSYVFDVSGGVLAVLERENSQPVSLAQVPGEVVAAILAVEDEAFWLHKGVNVRGLVRAALSNFSSGAPRQGASTITQQVVKNELLAGLERDGRYKLLQVHYALMLEKELSKQEILERYLNTVFFGNNAYGLQAAAEVYFGKGVESLSMVEGAFLAGLIRSPSGYDPIRRPDRSRARFRQVAQRLADVGLVTDEAAAVLGEEYPIPEVLQEIPNLAVAPSYFTEAVREYLLERSDILGATEQERANLLYRGGLRIYTTFDPVLQQYAEAAREVLPDNRAGIDAALVSVDAATGAVRAMVGGRGFIPREREINMALVPRQTGSSIKMFVLAAAIQAGATAEDQINGTLPCTLPNPGNPADPFLIRAGVSRGVLSLREATELSLNCAYSRLAQIVGLNRVVDTTYRMASSDYLYRGQPVEDRRPVEPYASFATGANEMSPLDMAAGAQTLANDGVHLEPYYVEAVDTADGTRLYTHAATPTRVFDDVVARTTTDILRGVLTDGTARRALADFPYPAAGKTGTQVENTNSWFVGYTPRLATAVWVGDPDGYTPMNTTNIPEFGEDGVERVQGGTYPAQIWEAYMTPALAGADNPEFLPPPPPTRPPTRLYLPDEECLYRVSGSGGGGSSPPATTPAATAPAAPADGATEGRVEAWAPPPPDPEPEVTEPPAPEPSGPSAPVATRPPVVVQRLPSGTTIPPGVLDPRAPMPSVATNTRVAVCAAGPR